MLLMYPREELWTCPQLVDLCYSAISFHKAVYYTTTPCDIHKIHNHTLITHQTQNRKLIPAININIVHLRSTLKVVICSKSVIKLI